MAARTSTGRSPPPRRRSRIARAGRPGPPASAVGRWPSSRRSIKEHTEELAQLESRNVGKPITGARGEITGVSLVFDYYAGAANKIFGQTIPVSKPGLDLTLREPIGVVGLIVPWNFPLLMASWKVAPALAAGNTAILKPASYSPLTAIRLGELALEAGIPAGVLNVVTGPGRLGRRVHRGPSGHRQGRLHRRDDDRPGDHAAGRGQREEDLARARRQEPEHRLRRRRPREVRPRVAVLGLRQHRPGLLRPEPRSSSSGRPTTASSSCSPRRRARSWSACPSDDATEVGTLVSFKQRDRVRDYIEIGLGEGATIVVGGDAPEDPALADGAYLMPTVFDGVSNDMRIAREEIFGPVVSIIAFDTEEEALRLANATPYGLSGSIWSRDIGKALRAAKALQAGVISVNSNSSVHTEAPFGGYKMSGIGRELGMSALELYTETKNVFIDLT